MCFLFCYSFHRMKTILDYDPHDLQDKSLYDFHHAGDAAGLLGSFKSGECSMCGSLSACMIMVDC